MKRLSFLSLVSIAVLFLPGFVLGYHILNDQAPSGNFIFRRWATTAIDFRVDPGTLQGGNGRSHVEFSCHEWDSVACARKLCEGVFQGPEDVTIANFETIFSSLDGVNDVVFDETGEIVEFLGFSPTSTLGITIITSNTATGKILDTLMVLNGTIQNSNNVDMRSTIVHEMGHVFGMAHIAIGGVNTVNTTPGLEPVDPSFIPTMYAFNIPVDDSFGRTLEIDDKAGICVRYPSN